MSPCSRFRSACASLSKRGSVPLGAASRHCHAQGGTRSAAEAAPPRFETDAKGQRDPELSEKDAVIARLHRDACEAKAETYTDPATGHKVFTEFAHLQRGKCCGSGCRHCPYGQVNVKDPAKKKKFNSAFYA